MTFNNLNDLMKHIQNDIDDCVQNEVAETVKDEMVTAIQTSVYNVYDPIQYTRRYGDGGLGARDNIEIEKIPHGISAKDVAPLDNGRTDYDLGEIIINGWGNMPFPRDYIGECAERLEITGNHVYALKQGLKNKGYEVK